MKENNEIFCIINMFDNLHCINYYDDETQESSILKYCSLKELPEILLEKSYQHDGCKIHLFGNCNYIKKSIIEPMQEHKNLYYDNTKIEIEVN